MNIVSQQIFINLVKSNDSPIAGNFFYENKANLNSKKKL